MGWLLSGGLVTCDQRLPTTAATVSQRWHSMAAGHACASQPGFGCAGPGKQMSRLMPRGPAVVVEQAEGLLTDCRAADRGALKLGAPGPGHCLVVAGAEEGWPLDLGRSPARNFAKELCEATASVLGTIVLTEPVAWCEARGH